MQKSMQKSAIPSLAWRKLTTIGSAIPVVGSIFGGIAGAFLGTEVGIDVGLAIYGQPEPEP